MKRLLIFTALFPPLALLVYVAPLVLNEGVPKADFIVFLIGAAYVLAIVPAGLAAAADGMLSAKPLAIRMGAAIAAAVVTAHLVARSIGDSMSISEVVTVAGAAAIPAAVCSWLSGRRQERWA